MLEAKFSEDPYRYNDKNMGRFVNLFTYFELGCKNPSGVFNCDI